ncbi:MAG TPA: hypothetical protein PKA64_13425 [Myxococcota bacterium]|nr:hypothetical protein [Myxococcota bacterium]
MPLPAICVEARVDADLTHIEGVLVADGLDEADWVDALAALSIPEHDLDMLRTFPGRPERGAVRWSTTTVDVACGRRDARALVFQTTLPRRYGDTGATRAGLFANGGWYPQPMVGDRLATATWDVTVTLPPDTLGALGDMTGPDALRWTGASDRASLAVLPRAVRTQLAGDGWSIDLLTRGEPRPGMLRQLPQQLDLYSVDGAHLSGAVVEAPLRERLSVDGAGTGYLSDRSWRVFPWFYRLHHQGASEGLAAAFIDRPDAFERRLAAAGLAIHQARHLKQRERLDLPGPRRAVIGLDGVLYDITTPFQDDVLHRAHPIARTADELTERLAPAASPDAAMLQLADAHGQDVAVRVARRLALGWSLADALVAEGLPADHLDPWRAPYPRQDYTLDLQRGVATITRDAPPDALAETVVVQAGDARYATTVGPGPDVVQLDVGDVRSIRLDPGGHLGQVSRVGERRPPTLRLGLAGQIEGINASQGFVDAFLQVTLRRSDDSWNRFRTTLYTDQRQHLGARFTYTRFFGPIRRFYTRAHQLSFYVDGAWLNTRFSDLDDANFALGGGVSWLWDSRDYAAFPLDGWRVSASLSVGGAPETGQSFASLQGTVVRITALHPRHALALRLNTGASFTDIAQRRNRFGGLSGVRGIPDDAVQTELQGVGSIEYRVAPLRQAGVPLGPALLDELDLTVGLDAGVGIADGERVAGVGATVGAGVNLLLGGFTPQWAGVTFGFPLYWSGFDLPERSVPFELYVTWGFTF